MDTFDKLDRVDLQILRTFARKRPIDNEKSWLRG